MKYEYKIPIHPMTETPEREFQYVYGEMLGAGVFPPEHFSQNRLNGQGIRPTGWISAKVERIPILEEGKWYLVSYNGEVNQVMYYSGGMLRHDSLKSSGYPISKYDILCEMKEANDE